MIQQLTAANLALTATVSTLTATNKNLVDAASRPRGPPAGTRAGGARPTKNPFPGNYCWTHSHRICKEHTSATCTHQAIGHCTDATALNTLGGSKKDKGWSMARTCWRGMVNVVIAVLMICVKTIIIILYPHLPAVIPPTFHLHTLALPTPAPADFTLHPALLLQISTQMLPPSESKCQTASLRGLLLAQPLLLSHLFHLQQCRAMCCPPSLISSSVWAPLLGCSIVFTKTAVNVIDPDGQSILEGWWEQDGPQLWRFPLKAKKPSLLVTALLKNNEEPGPRVSAANFSLPLPATPIQRPASPLPSPPPPTVVPPPTPSPHPPVVPPVRHLHPSQGVQATSANGEACSVLYLYGAAQAMAMAARHPAPRSAPAAWIYQALAP
jgi:hypothetical protein